MSKTASYQSKQDTGIVRERKAVVVERELDAIYAEHDTLTTDLILEKARNKKHPLHAYFDWDDTVAAEKWRQTQALQLVMATKFAVVLNGSAKPPQVVHGTPVRKFVSAFRGEGFKMRNEALNETDTRRALIERRIGALRSWCREAVDIEELAPLRSAIQKLLPPEAG